MPTNKVILCGATGIAGCNNIATKKATFTDKKTGEVTTACYCEHDYKEAYDLRGLGMTVRVEALSDVRCKNCKDKYCTGCSKVTELLLD